MDFSEASRRILETFEPDVPPWSIVLTEGSDEEKEPKAWTDLFQETKNPIELGELRAVKPEVLAKWREWAVPDDIIEKAVRQRTAMAKKRAVEEWINLPNFAYKMPRLPEIETQAWGVAKSIDFEGYIDPYATKTTDKLEKTDKWLYKYTFQRPRVGIQTTTYEPIEEIANMMHVFVTIRRMHRPTRKAYVITYAAEPVEARAVRICYLIKPHLRIPEKIARAETILETYREKPRLRLR